MRLPNGPRPTASPWMTTVLRLAGVYNLSWGAAVVLLPAGWTVGWTGMEVGDPAIWRCVGMIVGVYGVGYLCAAPRPLRHWPVVLVGFLGKTFGTVGFLWGAVRGEVPWALGWVNVANDLVWWPFFAAILLRAWDHHAHGDVPARAPLEEALERAATADGPSLRDLSDDGPVLLLAVRHAGCTFCRSELADLAADRDAIEAAGLAPAVLTMSSTSDAAAMLDRHGLGDVPAVSDPDRTLYRALGLGRGGAAELCGPAVWRPGLAAFLKHGVGPMDGDGFQMPGAFVIRRGRVVAVRRHRHSGDSADLRELANAVPR